MRTGRGQSKKQFNHQFIISTDYRKNVLTTQLSFPKILYSANLRNVTDRKNDNIKSTVILKKDLAKEYFISLQVKKNEGVQISIFIRFETKKILSIYDKDSYIVHTFKSYLILVNLTSCS